MKKQHYITLLILVIISLLAYICFVNTALFVPKQEEIVNSKGLFKEVLREVTKIEKKSDTIIFIYASLFGVCGNEYDGMSGYDKKINEIKYNKEHPYFIDLEKSFDEVNKINDKIIIVGHTITTDGLTSFRKLNSHQVDLKINVDPIKNGFNCYKAKYKIINQNKIEVSISLNDFENYNFNESENILKLILTESNGEWVSKQIKI